jgi:hypothetical protein
MSKELVIRILFQGLVVLDPLDKASNSLRRNGALSLWSDDEVMVGCLGIKELKRAKMIEEVIIESFFLYDVMRCVSILR